MVSAWDVTKFYAMLTFCNTLIGNKLFKIVFLFETTFIFPQHYLSRDVCMTYPDSYWPKRLSVILRGRVHPSVVWCLEFLSNGDYFSKFQTLFMLRDIGESFHKSHFRDQHQKMYLAT